LAERMDCLTKACGHSDDLRDSRRGRNLIQDCKLEVSLESFDPEG
jgi:hypothetical protein